MKSKINHIVNAIARRLNKMTEHWAARYWHDYPFGRTPRATKAQYLTLWEAEREASYPPIDDFEREAGYAVDSNWMHDLALHTQIVIKSSPLCYQHGRVLYSALRRYLKAQGAKPVTIFETGTARGFSAVVMARALKDAGASGKIVTFDVLPQNVEMLWNCIDDLDAAKSRAELLAPWAELVDDYIVFIEGDSRINLTKVVVGRIGFAFLDGAHTHRDVLFEFGAIAARQQPGDVIVFDDYNTQDFAGLVRAVDEGCALFGYDKQIVSCGAQRCYVIATKEEL